MPRIVVAFVLLCAACRPPPPTQQLVRNDSYAMGTSIVLMAWTPDAAVAHAAFDAALTALQRLEEMMTTWVHPGWPESDIMRLNAVAGGANAVPMQRETMEVLACAQQMSERSGGVFDVTMGAMGGLWHFDEDLAPVVPDANLIAQRRALVDFHQLVLDTNARTARLLRPGMAVNLGGIAKGYAVDAMARVLQRAGLRNVLLQAGGDLLVLGRKPEDAWRVGIRDPRGVSPDEPFAVAPITDHAFSTAGDYERAFEVDGKRYHHILDPRTGYPADASRSVTILAPSALLADALDDAVFILGPKRGMQLLEAYPGAGAVIVDANNRVWISPTLQEHVTVLHPPTP